MQDLGELGGEGEDVVEGVVGEKSVVWSLVWVFCLECEYGHETR